MGSKREEALPIPAYPKNFTCHERHLGVLPTSTKNKNPRAHASKSHAIAGTMETPRAEPYPALAARARCASCPSCCSQRLSPPPQHRTRSAHGCHHARTCWGSKHSTSPAAVLSRRCAAADAVARSRWPATPPQIVRGGDAWAATMQERRSHGWPRSRGPYPADVQASLELCHGLQVPLLRSRPGHGSRIHLCFVGVVLGLR